MTISICWQRKLKDTDEIIFASDSRISAGYRWDCAQKIFPIQGPNFCISFSGHTDFAFPCIFQFQTMVRNHKKFFDGAASIRDVTGNFIALCNHMFTLVDDRKIAEFNKTQFIVAGYDFNCGAAYQKIVRFNPRTSRYQGYGFKGISTGTGGQALGFIGDGYDQYMSKLSQVFKSKRVAFDYEPLDVLNDVLSAQDKHSHIGGFPQVVKVYRHRNYLPFAVKAKASDKDVVALFGRPLMPHERTLYPIIDLGRIGKNNFISYPMAPLDSIKSVSR